MKLSQTHRIRLRRAETIRQQVDKANRAGDDAALAALQTLLETAETLRGWNRRWNVCRQRNWHAARRRLEFQLERHVDALHTAVGHLRRITRQSESVPTLREVWDDLDALEEEFPQVQWDARSAKITVTTEPIQMEGLYLGAFAIRVDLHRICETNLGSVFRVIALDPQPAGGSNRHGCFRTPESRLRNRERGGVWQKRRNPLKQRDMFFRKTPGQFPGRAFPLT